MMRTPALLAGVAAVTALPALTPQDPTLPPGHPPTSQPETPAAVFVPVAEAADVESIEAIVGAYYDVISAPAGEERDWDRFRSLFLPDAQLVTSREAGGAVVPVVIGPDDYVTMNDRYFTQGGYYENELAHRVDRFGRIAQVFSTYASRRRPGDPPYSRGINAFQLFDDGERWWIVAVTWDYERADTRLPPEYLPPGDHGG